MRRVTRLLLLIFCGLFLFSCGMQKQLAKRADRDILDNPDFASAHIGISLYDPSTGQYLYDHQGDKFFVPASNTKILTCYAAMKYLGDSLLALRYITKPDGSVEIEPNADASFLHPDFKQQPVFDFLSGKKKVFVTDNNWRDNALGFGWAWDDYNSDYMAERSVMPVYGNIVRVRQTDHIRVTPSWFQKQVDAALQDTKGNFSIRRDMTGNTYTKRTANTKFTSVDMPMYTRESQLLTTLLADTLKTKVEQIHAVFDRTASSKIHSQSLDSLLTIMMHRSDNFFAEQTLLMVSNEKLGYMNSGRIIDTLLKTGFGGMPQKPRWVDGSGLSRYNLVSPQDFVWVLTQMRNEFKWDRIQTIFPTGGEGTLSSYYKNYAGRVYAKTGSLSNHLALSGYITTKKGKLLIFSVLVNAEMAPAANIRKGVEKFLTGIMDAY
jgi:D-alanyl-D-alanine carboxypeptidase/D-alanyl-D-alanine-endopeptidase (penicillin-binding protein 4)